MTTAEKRATLEAQGLPWPNCECHNKPKGWQRNPALTGGGRFHCQVRKQEGKRAFRQSRRDAGLCVHCGAPVDTESMCQGCADAHADLMAQPKQKLDHYLAQIRSRNRQQTEFRSTGAGLAAFAAYIRNRGAE